MRRKVQLGELGYVSVEISLVVLLLIASRKWQIKKQFKKFRKLIVFLPLFQNLLLQRLLFKIKIYLQILISSM